MEDETSSFNVDQKSSDKTSDHIESTNGKTEKAIRPKDKKIIPLTYSDTKLTKEELYEKYKDIDNLQSIGRSKCDA